MLYVYVEAAMDEFRKALAALNQQDEEPEEVVEEYDDEETLDEKMKRLAEEVCMHVCMHEYNKISRFFQKLSCHLSVLSRSHTPFIISLSFMLMYTYVNKCI